MQMCVVSLKPFYLMFLIINDNKYFFSPEMDWLKLTVSVRVHVFGQRIVIRTVSPSSLISRSFNLVKILYEDI